MDSDATTILLFLPVAVLSWIAISNLAAIVGGWRDLAVRYGHDRPFLGERIHFCSGRLPLASYGGCLILGVNEAGLYVAASAPFAFGHQPLLIPWTETRARLKHGLLSRRVELQFDQVPSTTLVISQRLAKKLEATSHGRLAIQAPA